MNIEAFVASTLIGVVDGVRTANARIGEKNGRAFIVGGDMTKYLTFDVAVTARSEGEISGQGSADILVASFDGEAKVKGSNEHVSRIKFTVELNGFAVQGT